MKVSSRWITAFVLSSPSGYLHADPLSFVRDSNFNLNISYSQQEYGTIALDLLGPTIGAWGRFGVNFGQSAYYLTDSAGLSQLHTAIQSAFAWNFEEVLLPISSTLANQALGLSTTLRLGEVHYDARVGDRDVSKRHGFFEFEFLLKFVSSAKDPLPDRWIKGTSLGFGVGVRSNGVSKAVAIGQSEVQDLRIYPTLQLTMLMF